MARIFEPDGNFDNDTIAFFLDYDAQPAEGCVYFCSRGNFKFERFTIPESTTGCWHTMEAGDLDGDGRTDIVLSNFSIRPSVTNPRFDRQEGPLFICLKHKQMIVFYYIGTTCK